MWRIWNYSVDNYEKLSSEQQAEPSNAARERVTAARVSQSERFRGTGLLTNADIGPAEVRRFCQLSARAYHRVLKLARTIADLADVLGFRLAYLREVISY